MILFFRPGGATLFVSLDCKGLGTVSHLTDSPWITCNSYVLLHSLLWTGVLCWVLDYLGEIPIYDSILWHSWSGIPLVASERKSRARTQSLPLLFNTMRVDFCCLFCFLVLWEFHISFFKIFNPTLPNSSQTHP